MLSHRRASIHSIILLTKRIFSVTSLKCLGWWQGGLPMRSATETNNKESKCSRPMKADDVPYGYAYLEGRPVKEPKEYKVVLQIQNHWQTGKGGSASNSHILQ